MNGRGDKKSSNRRRRFVAQGSTSPEVDQQLTAVSRIAPFAILIIRRSDRRIVEVNDAFTRFFGFTRDEAVGKTPRELGIQTDPSTPTPLMDRLAATGSVDDVEVELRSKSGNAVTCSASLAFLEFSGERCAIGFFQDITEKRAVDQALRRGEADLRAMFDAAPFGIAQADPVTLRLSRVNPRLCAILGYSEDELLVRTIAALTHPDDRAQDEEVIASLLRGAAAQTRFEKRYLRKDGRVVWADVTVQVLRDDAGAPRRMFATIEDVSERRKAARELELQVSAFDAAANCIIITDPAGIVLRANPATVPLTGYTQAEMVGRPLRLLHPDTGSRALADEVWKTLHGGRVWRGEIVNSRKDGTLYHEDKTITPVRGESGEITHFIVIKQDITERKRTEAALAESAAWLRLALTTAELGTWKHDVATNRMHLDALAMRHFCIDHADIEGDEMFSLFHPDDVHLVYEAIAQTTDPTGDGRAPPLELRLVMPSGETRWVTTNAQVIFEGEGAARHGISTVVTSRDITAAKLAEQHHKDTEEQLRAAQKMEAVGRLAGGVAHDFNNLLSVILSYAEVVAMEIAPDAPMHGDLDEIIRAAKRAGALTEQLLAFSRKQVLTLQSLDVNELVDGVGKMLRRLIGEDVELDVSLGHALWKTRADRGQLEQVLMNLAVNARDAMPGGGTLGVRTENVVLDGDAARVAQVEAGAYVELSVTDSGTGMSSETLARIFEPFFTTKGLGKGTGLGLSTVYGIVSQLGGGIVVRSALGAGTTFRIYLKRDETTLGEEPESGPRLLPVAGRECVLVIEDEEAIRRVMSRVLSAEGYTVFVAANPAEALLLCEQHGEEFDLLLSDVIMPNLNGRELIERLRPLCPSAKALFMSGYTDDALERVGVVGRDFLRKPFSRECLLEKVRATLDGKGAGSSIPRRSRSAAPR